MPVLKEEEPQKFLLDRPTLDEYRLLYARYLSDARSLVRDCAAARTGPEHTERAELHRLLDVAQSRVDKIRKILSNHVLIEPATSTDVVSIGTVVTLKRYDKNGNPYSGTVTYRIGCYGSSDAKTLSYESILVQDLLGKKVGEFALIRNSEEYEILKIELPQDVIRRAA